MKLSGRHPDTRHTREFVEMALAHWIGNRVEATYRRGDLFEKRRARVDDWGRFATGQIDSVVAPPGARA